MSIADELISAAQAADIRQRANAFHAWMNGRTSIKEADIPASLNRPSNDELGRCEQFEVWRDKPASLFAYIGFRDPAYKAPRVGAHMVRASDLACVSVWTGAALGHGRVNKVWRANFGDRRASVRVRIAGCDYAGTAFLDAGDYCRLRKVRA